MGLKGKFEFYQSLRQGGRKDISFTLTCDNIFQDETFDCAILAAQGPQQPMVFRQLKLKAKQSYRFNFDTVDWQWCDGDSFVVLGKNDAIINQWPLNIQTYRPGECPECHGTQKCHSCNGKGYVNVPNYRVESCTVCAGTGVCQTCYVPRRKPNQGLLQPGYSPNHNSSNNAKERQIASMKNRISELQRKAEKTEWDMRMMELNGTSTTSFNVYSSYNQLLYRYRESIIKLQSQIEQLESL